MKKSFFVSAILISLTLNVLAQDSIPDKLKTDVFSLGMGIGLDYGGIGYSALYYPQRNIGLFAACGYAFAGISYNTGLKIRYPAKNPSAKSYPYLLGMYGYNAVVLMDREEYNRIFYGLSLGCGLDYRPNPDKNAYWSFSLIVPFRDPEYDNYIESLENRGAEFNMKPFPVLVSVGCRLIIK